MDAAAGPVAIERRRLLADSAGSAGMSAAAAAESQPAAAPARNAPTVAMLVYPGIVLLDLVGPQTALKVAGCEIALVARTTAPVATDVEVAVSPSVAFADSAAAPDVLLVPGGLAGTVQAMADPETIEWLRSRGTAAAWVTSVCTGSLLLGAAGLLRGYRATSHWAVRDLLSQLGATPDAGRVVEDRNRLTGGGVTAGLDLGLTLVERLFDRERAERVQLVLEYAPAPPFDSGRPETAAADLVAAVRIRRAPGDVAAAEAVRAAAARLGL